MENLPQERLTPRRFAAVAIGGSAGGIVAVGQLLAALPPDFRLPVIVVLHQHRHTDAGWCGYLTGLTGLNIVEAEDKMPLREGTVHCAPANYHLLVEDDATLSLSVDEKVNFARPSIDLLFSSAAETFGPALIGIVLSGANSDGAMGLADIAADGGLTIVQSRSSAQWPAMPAAALRAVPQAMELELEGIAALLAELNRKETCVELTHE